MTISFNLRPGVALGQAVDAIKKVEREIGKPESLIAQLPGHRAGVPGFARRASPI